MIKIIVNVEFINPPIPVRSFDYCATLEGQTESNPPGWGSCIGDSVRDLMAHVNDRDLELMEYRKEKT